MTDPKPKRRTTVLPDRIFWICFGVISGAYVLLIVLLLLADVVYSFGGEEGNAIMRALAQKEIQNSLILSLISCTISAFLAVGVAIPVGYVLSRCRNRLFSLMDAVLDIPIVLPPLVIGLSLLILFQFWPLTASIGGVSLSSLVVYKVPAVILAQFTVATAFAIRAVKVAFEQIDPRLENVALTLGASRFQVLNRVLLPRAFPGIVTAWTLAWARSLGEFGPLLIFAGATRNKTEVLSTSVFLEISIGNLSGAVAVSLIMVVAALVVLVIARIWGRSEVFL